MSFVAEKDPGLIPKILSEILDSCVNGITLADPDQDDMPIVYANQAFTRMTGYSLEETLGKNCRFLQGEERDQPERFRLRDAIDRAEPIEVTLKNYRKDGTLFYNRLSLTPLLDPSGKLMYYLGVQYDVTAEITARDEISRLKKTLDILE